jgi:hypothetical protein
MLRSIVNTILVMFEVRSHDNTCIPTLYEQESVVNDLEPCELCTSKHHDKAFSRKNKKSDKVATIF